MGIPLRVLFIEDSELDAELTAAELARGDFELQMERVETEDDMSAALADADWDLVICDYRLPRFSAEDALSTLKNSNKDLPFIITSGAVTAEDVVSLLKQGAHDFMDKNALARLVPAVERELRDAKIREQRRVAEQRVRVLSRAIEQSPVSVVITDPKGHIEYVNPRFEETTGYTSSEAMGRSLGFTLLDEESASAMDELWSTVSSGVEWRGEFCNVKRDGQLIWEAVNVSPLTDPQGTLTHYVVIKEDITVRRSYEEQLLRQAHYDHLTGLANRVLLMDRLTVALENAARTGQQTALLGIDLDHFKNVNDSLGHSVGDNLLKEAAQRLSSCIRGGDTLARMGGDEFVVVLPQITNLRDVHKIAENIVRQFERPFTIIGKDYFVTSSVGIALYPEDGGNPHLILRNADLAMYKAKDLGRNQYHFFTEDINQRLMQRLELETRIRHVITKDELLLHYQPIYNLSDNSVAGFEALVRWRQADGSLRMPGDFIPVAEDIGIIQEIDSWVLQAACKETSSLLNQQPGELRLAINISPRQLEAPGYADFVRRQLSLNHLKPSQLELEITERVLVNDAEATRTNIEALCNLGVRLSIDDFGTGYSSLGYLQKYPFHTLKIDRSFVSNISENPNARRLIETIITMAHGLDMEVVAEGIESEQERRFLMEHGCDQAQGFLLSRPLPLHDVISNM
ncbi:bifunctional diguanylate cyclase/phosphodiesterase [Marinimicrobium sp. ABcell2]|uniref:putative bifunctional diguanylate cyclase/phosphodiesterase n=1 Tax=Marinimicrobium sp. ABcell2 TaxID=3069751 RepID=UPI0027ADB352|nr:GGDEF domain-containing response regulator [Marinimicrobium sp. ABcell2]MDQ2077924.1 EAL domain-containing protein [Marinimicrobium sp. ABcell2]